LVYTDFAYVDGYGTAHPFSGAAGWLYQQNVDLPLPPTTTFDGSGYTLTFDASNGAYSLYSSDGASLLPATTAIGPGSTASVIDRNGNTISLNSNGTFTDTL
jgi:hypothetical protein